MAKEDRNGCLHSEANGRFIRKTDAEKRKDAEKIYNTHGHLEETSRKLAYGMRQPRTRILTLSEIETIKEHAKELGISENILKFNKGYRTSFDEESGCILIRGDILPDNNSDIAGDRLTVRAVLAHEYYGHYMHHPSEYEIGDWRDEYRASREAALKAPNLSQEERACLMLDAYDRQKSAGVFQGYDKIAKEIIYGKQD